MSCKHLKELYELCGKHDIKLSSSDLIRIVCPKCGIEETCPSILVEQYEALRKEVDKRSPPKEE
jgi:hypothetical protein